MKRLANSSNVAARPVDLLVRELAHFEPEELFDYLSDKRFGQLVLIHLGRAHWENLERTKLLAESRLKGVKVRFAHACLAIPEAISPRVAILLA